MLYPDLKSYISALESVGELVRVRQEVDAELEIGCIADRISRLPKDRNKAILFERVKNSPMPVLINTFGSERRQSMMAGVADYAGMTQKLSGLLEVLQTPRKNLVEKIKALPVLRDVARCFPTYVKRAPCQKMVYKGDAIDLNAIPILKTWPEDAGNFVTLPLVFTKDPENGKRNCGMYRLQRYDRNTLGFHCHTHHTGAHHLRKAAAMGKDRLEVAVCIGAQPAVTFSAVVPLPPGLDEMIFAGFLNEAPVAMVKCLTIEQEVPAEAEIVLEGYVMINERRREGPFGDHTGFYSLADDYWVFHCTAVTMKPRPIYHATIVGPPPQEDSHMAAAIERLFLPLMQQPLPEVRDYWLPFEGVAHNLMLADIEKHYPGQGLKIAQSVWGLGQAMFTKAIVVGSDVGDKLTDGEAWARRLAREIDVARDVQIVRGPTETLDHATPELHFGSKLSFDLTRAMDSEGARAAIPATDDGFSDAEILTALQCRMPRIKRALTPFKGDDRHLLLLALDKVDPSIPAATDLEAGVRDMSQHVACHAREAITLVWELFPELACAQRVIVFDGDEMLDDVSRMVWLGLANLDPERDLVFDYQAAERGIAPHKHPRRLGVDCTAKSLSDGFTRRWPKEQSWPRELIDRVGERWDAMGLPKLSDGEHAKLFTNY